MFSMVNVPGTERRKPWLALCACVTWRRSVEIPGEEPQNPPVPGDHRDGGMRPPSWWEPSSPDIKRKGQLRTFSVAEARRAQMNASSLRERQLSNRSPQGPEHFGTRGSR